MVAATATATALEWSVAGSRRGAERGAKFPIKHSKRSHIKQDAQCNKVVYMHTYKKHRTLYAKQKTLCGIARLTAVAKRNRTHGKT